MYLTYTFPFRYGLQLEQCTWPESNKLSHAFLVEDFRLDLNLLVHRIPNNVYVRSTSTSTQSFQQRKRYLSRWEEDPGSQRPTCLFLWCNRPCATGRRLVTTKLSLRVDQGVRFFQLVSKQITYGEIWNFLFIRDPGCFPLHTLELRFRVVVVNPLSSTVTIMP